MASDGLRIRFLVSDDGAIGSLWQELEERVGTGGLTCSWRWTETWLRHYGHVIPHIFVVGERSEPCAVALLTKAAHNKRGPFQISTFHLGTAGEPDADTVRVQYNRVLVDPTDHDTFMHGMVDLLRSSKLSWDEFRLDGFPAEEISAYLKPDSSFVTSHRPCYVTELAKTRGAGKSVLNALDSQTAKKIRRSIRILEEAHEPFELNGRSLSIEPGTYLKR